MWVYSPFSHMTQLAAQVSVLHSVTLNTLDVKPNIGDTHSHFSALAQRIKFSCMF